MPLAELDHDYSIHARQGAGDEKLYVVFRNHFTLDDDATDREGRPVHRDEVFTRIVTPGNRDSIVDRPLRPTDKIRWPKQWAAFQAGEQDIGQGTRLEEWSPMPRSLVEDLRYLGFRTVEHVADAHDEILGKTPGLREWAGRAKAFLMAAKDSAVITQAVAERERMQAQINALTEQVEALSKLAKTPEGATALPTGKQK